MATINLYVSEALREQMREHESELNWSRLASDAFQRAIDLERTRAMNIEQAALQRLKISRESAGDQRRAEGMALGKQWAQETSEFEELERLANIEEWRLVDGDNAHWKVLATAVTGRSDLNWQEIDWAIQPIFGSRKPTLDEVSGFIEGATAVFHLVP